MGDRIMVIWNGENRQPTQQESRIGVKGDPTPDAEYGDEPEHPSNHSDNDGSDPRKVLKCTECSNKRRMTREKFHAYSKHTCSRMTFNPEVGEVPCGGEMKVVDQ